MEYVIKLTQAGESVTCKELDTGREIQKRIVLYKYYKAIAIMEFWNMYYADFLTETAQKLCSVPCRCYRDGVFIDALGPLENKYKGLCMVEGKGRIAEIGGLINDSTLVYLLNNLGYNVIFNNEGV